MTLNHYTRTHYTHYRDVMKRLNPIKELYNLYLEEKDSPRIVEIKDDDIDLALDIEGPVDPYLDL